MRAWIRFNPPPAHAGDATRAVPRGEVTRSVTSPSLRRVVACRPRSRARWRIGHGFFPRSGHTTPARPSPAAPASCGQISPRAGAVCAVELSGALIVPRVRIQARFHPPLAPWPHVLRRASARPSCQRGKRTSHRGCGAIALDSLASRPSWTTKNTSQAKFPNRSQARNSAWLLL